MSSDTTNDVSFVAALTSSQTVLDLLSVLIVALWEVVICPSATAISLAFQRLLTQILASIISMSGCRNGRCRSLSYYRIIVRCWFERTMADLARTIQRMVCSITTTLISVRGLCDKLSLTPASHPKSS